MKSNPTCIICKQSPCKCENQAPKKQGLKEAIAEILEGMEHQIKFAQIKARLCRAYYSELIKRGFSRDEALELCKYYQM